MSENKETTVVANTQVRESLTASALIVNQSAPQTGKPSLSLVQQVASQRPKK